MTITSIEEVMRRAKRIRHEMARRDSEDYVELVMFQDSLGELAGILESYFGPATKPAGREAPDHLLRRIERYGGVERDQTLYFAEREEAPSLALIWPWGDGKRATVKILRGDA